MRSWSGTAGRPRGSCSWACIGAGPRSPRCSESEIETAHGGSLPEGSIDITLYRDDLGTVGPRPLIGESELPSGGIDDKSVVLVDDVAYTGRTMRAAMNELSDWGRPKRILLCVLVDRGGRELPIQPDFIGRRVDVGENQRVEVRVPELDGRLEVELVATGAAEA